MNPFGVKVHIFGGNTGKQEIKQFRWAEVKEIKIQLNLDENWLNLDNFAYTRFIPNYFQIMFEGLSNLSRFVGF